jgi:DNA segregation ATPase FtsK/SpoIIIE, S-DNA-T family
MSIDNEAGQPPRLLPQTIEDVLRAWMLRCTGVALIAAAAMVWAVMLTWSANDPSLSLNTSEPAKNLLGAPGALAADFFFHTLGLSVVFFAVPPVVLGLQLALGETVMDLRRRLALFAVSTVAIAGGCSALPLTQYWPMELGYGGIIGDFAYSVIVSIFDQLLPQISNSLSGLVFFALGFWAFSRAVCIDRYSILSMRLPALRSLGTASVSNHAPRPTQVAAQSEPKLELYGLDRQQPIPSAPLDHSTRVHDRAPIGQSSEPAPQAWSLDAKIHDYDASIGGSEFGWPPHDLPQQSSHSNAERAREPSICSPEGLSTEQMAERLVNDQTMGQEATREMDDQHQVILLDDEPARDADDLPNVLKRAKQEAMTILQPQRGEGLVKAPFPLLPMPGSKAAMTNPRPGGTENPEQSQSKRGPETVALQPKVVATGYRRPSLNLLKAQKPTQPSADMSPAVLQGRARMLEDVLGDFRIKGSIKDVRPGPVITLFELEPSRGTKSSRVIALADDVARSMSSVSTRIAVVPGRNAIGIELPNTRRETFGLRELIDSQDYLDAGANLPLVLGKGIGGEPVLTDLARMPHLLVAGTTGSGKSVGVNAMILSLIYRLGPEDCRFLMIDPKMLELSAYNGIPHLLTPVVTDPQKAVTALAWAVGEMEERYKRMAELGVRNIDAYNTRVKHAARTGEKLGRTVQTGFDPATGEAVFEEMSFDTEKLPYIVIVVDEFADLMAVAGKEIEGLVQRLAQMARAAGIHMIMATQRPSVDVVTGTIKANFPTRISYRVASRIDSRTILNEQGGEQLLGQGDMLFLDGTGTVQRVHGPFVSDDEVEAVATSLRKTYPPRYIDDVLKADVELDSVKTAPDDKPADLYEEALAIVLRDQKASTSYLQRRLSIGYNRAADLIDRMEEAGVIGAANHAGRREILLAG